ncbi:MAG: hypothetical protein ACXWPM_06590 [Bdellovibrionota bacterium]
MGAFTVKIETTEGSTVLLRFEGKIDEESSFDRIQVPATSKIVFDLKAIEAINSCGIREWIKWIKAISPGKRLVYRHCPRVIVDQINMVDGFLPEGASVESFELPYFCENCSLITSIQILMERDCASGTPKLADTVPCSKCGKEAEMDVVEGKYFRFLKP